MDQEKKDEKRCCSLPVKPIVIGAAAVFCIMVITAICSECGKGALPPDNVVNVIIEGGDSPVPPAIPGDELRNHRIDRKARAAIAAMSKGAVPPPMEGQDWTQLPPMGGKPVPPGFGGAPQGAPCPDGPKGPMGMIPPCPQNPQGQPVPPCPMAMTGQSSDGPHAAFAPRWEAKPGCALGKFEPKVKAERIKIMIERNMNLLKYAGERLPLRDVKKLVDDTALLKARLLEMKPMLKDQKAERRPPAAFSVKKMMDEKDREKALSRQVFQQAEIIAKLGRIEGQLSVLDKLMEMMRRQDSLKFMQKKDQMESLIRKREMLAQEKAIGQALEKADPQERMGSLKKIIEKARERAKERQEQLGQQTYRDFLNEIYRQPQVDAD